MVNNTEHNIIDLLIDNKYSEIVDIIFDKKGNRELPIKDELVGVLDNKYTICGNILTILNCEITNKK